MRTTRMFRGLSLICCLAGTLFVSDASGQGKSGQGSGLISSSTITTCVPGFDLTCSPKVEVGITKPSRTKKGLVLKRDSLPFNQSDTEIIPFKMDPSGSCGVSRSPFFEHIVLNQ